MAFDTKDSTEELEVTMMRPQQDKVNMFVKVCYNIREQS